MLSAFSVIEIYKEDISCDPFGIKNLSKSTVACIFRICLHELGCSSKRGVSCFSQTQSEFLPHKCVSGTGREESKFCSSETLATSSPALDVPGTGYLSICIRAQEFCCGWEGEDAPLSKQAPLENSGQQVQCPHHVFLYLV